MQKNNNIAYLYNKDGYTFFKIGKEIIRFLTSPYLYRYKQVKEYDNGYIVVDAEYIDPANSNIKYTEEEYVDINYIMTDLGLDTKILSLISEVRIL